MTATLARYMIATIWNGEAQIACVSRRAPSGIQRRFEMDAAASAAGFELRHLDTHVNPEEWPLLALVYRSPNREGIGRAGSTLYRIRCRRVST